MHRTIVQCLALSTGCRAPLSDSLHLCGLAGTLSTTFADGRLEAAFNAYHSARGAQACHSDSCGGASAVGDCYAEGHRGCSVRAGIVAPAGALPLPPMIRREIS